jgi:hypothetical protein
MTETDSVHKKLWILNMIPSLNLGRAIAESVSRWLPTAAARVQSRVWSSGICGGQSGAGASFLLVLRFPLPFIPPNSPFSQSPGAGTIGQWVADVPFWTPPPTSLNLIESGATLWTGEQPVTRPLVTEDNTDMLASSGIRTHDPSVWAGKDTSCPT